jgi:hypothetical protein
MGHHVVKEWALMRLRRPMRQFKVVEILFPQVFIELLHSTTTLTIQTHTHLYEHTYANLTPIHLRRTEHLADLDIPKVTIGVSLSTGTSLTT